MLQENPGKLLILVLALALAVTSAVVAGEAGKGGEGDDEVIVEKDVKVIVKKLGDCADGEDCERRMVKVFVGEDGEVHHLEGGDVDWVGDHGCEHHGDHDCEHHGDHHGDHHGEHRAERHAVHAEHGHHARHLRHFRRHAGRHHGGSFLGVGLTDLTPELRAHFGVPDDAGVMVSKVIEDSPASRAGLKVGDIISGVGGEAVASGGSLARKIRRHEDGASATLEVWRDGRVETLTAILEKREGPHVMAMAGHGIDYDCGGADCEIEIDCGSGDCDCTVNGESIDCRQLHGEHSGDD